MKKITAVMFLLGFLLCLGMISSQAEEKEVKASTEYLLEKPAWGLIEWNSATLPQGYWYPSFDLVYLNNSTYFDNGKEKDYPRGRDSTSYIISGKLQYGVTNKLTFGVDIPVVAEQKVDTGGLYIKAKKAKSGVTNVGDIQLFLKYHVFDRYFWSLATELGTTLPTGQPYYNKISVKHAGTGDGKTGLNLALKGDILINEESFIKLGIRYTYQFKREHRNETGDTLIAVDTLITGNVLIDEKPRNLLGTNIGFVKNFRTFGMEVSLMYDWWQATEWKRIALVQQGDLFHMLLHFSLGSATPQKHGKLDFYLDFPVSGKNAAVTYRLGVSIKSILR